jgi:TonB family protein
MSATGEVDMRVGVGRDGSVRSVRRVKSSGNPFMDEAAETAMWATPFSPCLAASGAPVDCEIGFSIQLRRGRN